VVEPAAGGGLRHLAHGVLSLGDGAVETRLLALHEGLRRELTAHRPQLVAVEDVFSKHARSALVLGQARGVALLAAAQAGAVVRAFPPASIKQLVTGSGRAEKSQVGRMVSMLLGVKIAERVDATDALAAAICGLLSARAPAMPVVSPRSAQAAEVIRLLKARRR
jgi:crossover junction endodeoxyribonuclease RuvC